MLPDPCQTFLCLSINLAIQAGLTHLIMLRSADAWFLRPVVKPMNPGEVAFGEQLRFGLQPVLHIAPGPRTLVHITEVCPSGHFVR